MKEEMKILNHSKIQAVISKFWALLTKDEDGRINKEEYVMVSRLQLFCLSNKHAFYFIFIFFTFY